MSVETNSPPEQGPSPWALKQLRQFAEIASQIPPGCPTIIRLPVTEAMTGLTNQQLWEMEKNGRFPKRAKLNPDAPKNGACGHFLDEVLTWLAERRASRTAGGE